MGRKRGKKAKQNPLSALFNGKTEAAHPTDKNSIIVAAGLVNKRESFEVKMDNFVVPSPVFEEALRQAKTASNSQLIIPDITPKAFKEFLRFVTGDHVNFGTVEECKEVWEVAEKYSVQELRYLMEFFICASVEPANACDVFSIAKRFNSHKLETRCLTVFIDNTMEVLKSWSFKTADKMTVEKIVSCPIQALKSEVELFTALVEWGKLERLRCELPPSSDSLRLVLRPFLKYIRFLNMTPEDFVRNVVPEKIFSLVDEHALLINLISPNELAFPLPVGMNNTREPRMCKVLKPVYMNDSVEVQVGSVYQAVFQVIMGTVYIEDIQFPFQQLQGDNFYALVRISLEVNSTLTPEASVRKANFSRTISYTDGSYKLDCRNFTATMGDRLCITAVVVDHSGPLQTFRTSPIQSPSVVKVDGENVVIVVLENSLKHSLHLSKITLSYQQCLSELLSSSVSLIEWKM